MGVSGIMQVFFVKSLQFRFISRFSLHFVNQRLQKNVLCAAEMCPKITMSQAKNKKKWGL